MGVNGSAPIKFNQWWVAIGQQEAMFVVSALSEHNLLSTEAKLFLLAVGTMNNGGHAEFLPGELGKRLGKIDKSTGEVRPLDRAQVLRAKRKLADAGLLADYSGGVRCVWVNAAVVQRGKPNGNWRCRTHGDAKRGYLYDRATHKGNDKATSVVNPTTERCESHNTTPF